MQPWEESIKTLQTLQKLRNSPEWWSANIIDSSKNLTTKRDWSLFYLYLTNPAKFDPNSEIVTLDDLIVIPKIPEYEPGRIETRTQNGTETLIHVQNEDDEKIE